MAKVRVLMRVDDRDARGRPRRCTVVWPDDVIELTTGDEFVTADIDPRSAKQVDVGGLAVAKTDLKRRMLQVERRGEKG